MGSTLVSNPSDEIVDVYGFGYPLQEDPMPEYNSESQILTERYALENNVIRKTYIIENVPTNKLIMLENQVTDLQVALTEVYEMFLYT